MSRASQSRSSSPGATEDPPRQEPSAGRESNLVRRPARLWVALAAEAAGAVICLPALPNTARMSIVAGLILVCLVLGQTLSVIAAWSRPSRRRTATAAAAAGLGVVTWLASRSLGAFEPDPWAEVNTTIGLTGHLVAGLEVVATVLLTAHLALPNRRRSRGTRIVAGIAWTPACLAIAVTALAGVAGTVGSWFVPFPGDTVHRPAAGQMTQFEYCRPAGVPLGMDLYAPSTSRTAASAPLALYVHGGGDMLGSRALAGPGSALANHAGALFEPIRDHLLELGVAVAAIDYRKLPAHSWPAPLDDARCAVRFLRAHADLLRIDPGRICAWGSSAGGQLSALLGLDHEAAGSGQQWASQSNRIQCVVDMFGPPDFTHIQEASLGFRVQVGLGLGSSQQVLTDASPETHVAPGAPPFLILQGTDDPNVLPSANMRFADHLAAAGDSVQLVTVDGAGHGLDVADEQPSERQLVQRVADFILGATGGTARTGQVDGR